MLLSELADSVKISWDLRWAVMAFSSLFDVDHSRTITLIGSFKKLFFSFKLHIRDLST
jgi:hypothetical protein